MNFKELLKVTEIKVYKIAGKLNIRRVQFNKIENGIYNLDMLNLEKLIEIYRKSIEEIEIACEVTKDERRRNTI